MRALHMGLAQGRSSTCFSGRLVRHAATAASRGRGSPMVLYEELRQKFGYMGVVNQKEVGILDLYQIMRGVANKRDFELAMQTLNLFYNFGVKLKHRELTTRLLAAAMVAKQESEAVELIKLYGTWLEFPPDSSAVYAVMSHFLDKGEPLVVRELAKAVREDWRIVPEAPLYSLSIEAMLQLPADQDPLAEALLLMEDAAQMGVRLPCPLHLRLLDECLKSLEALAEAETDAEKDPEAEQVPDAALDLLRSGLKVADGLAGDGYLRGGANAATLCSVAWLFRHLSVLPEATRSSLLAGGDVWGAASLGGDWSKILESACL